MKAANSPKTEFTLPKGVSDSIVTRHKVIEEITETLNFLYEEKNFENAAIRKLVAAEAFVEKAQYHLTRRAERYERNAKMLLVFAALSGISFGFYLLSGLGNQVPDNPSGFETIIIVLNKLVVGSLFVASIAVPISLARSFFHESAGLYSRRHSLRFGRLFTFLKEGELSIDELQEAYSWNLSVSSAFERNSSEKSVRSAIGGLADSTSKLLESVTSLVEAIRKEK